MNGCKGGEEEGGVIDRMEWDLGKYLSSMHEGASVV